MYKSHILDKINKADIGKEPFYHMYIQDILPVELYNKLKEKNNLYNNPKYTQKRCHDNKSFSNNKYSLTYSSDPELKSFCELFSDKDIKLALLKKFFVEPEKFINYISIFKEECEFVYTTPDKMQDIHVDVPSKYVSVVFYLPDKILTEEEQYNNSTILYDNDLNPIKKAKYLPNSACIFAPHFYSYHGFHTTIDRNALVMFYVNNSMLKEDMRTTPNTSLERKIFKNNILEKMKKHPLIEYKDKNLEEIYNNCKINFIKGRVKL